MTFKECEGYEIDGSINSGALRCSITNKRDKIISSALTNQYNWYDINHDNDEVIENEAAQKHK